MTPSALTANYQLKISVTRQVALTQDRLHLKYAPQLPWAEQILTLRNVTNTTKQPYINDKRAVTTKDVHSHTRKANYATLYTSGSEDPESSTATCAFTTAGAATSYRLTYGSSTLQAELAGICQAQRHAVAYDRATTTNT